MVGSLAIVACCLAVAHAAPRNYAPTTWTLIGPFPNDSLQTATADGVTRAGFDKDFIGEDKTLFEGKSTEVTAGDLVDFTAHFGPDTDNKVAYAFGLIESERETTLHALFGSDDAAKVFVNGKLIHRIWTPGRGVDPESDRFSVPIKQGANTILVKVENVSGGWGFTLSLFDEEGLKAREWRQISRDIADREIVPAGGAPGYLLLDNKFPALVWRDALLLDRLVEPELKVRWFDGEANEVTQAEKMGPYIAYVEGKTAAGLPIRRMITFSRVQPDFVDTLWGMATTGKGLELNTRKPPIPGLSDSIWKAERTAVGKFTTRAFVESMFRNSSAAAFLNYLQDPNKPKDSHPLDSQFHEMATLIKVRRKVMGLSEPKFRLPQKTSKKAPTLRPGTVEEAGMKADTIKRLRPLLQAWSKEEGRPFSVVMARKGVVFLHEGFGVDKNELFYPASIGKTFFGILFAQFVDQGIVQPDEPIGKYLPDWPTTGDKAVTFRNCLTHTSGTAGHGTYGGLWNPTLDNAFSMWLPDLNPGVRFAYGGDGNNLASKALELISGQPMAKLLRNAVFAPLGANSIIEPDFGYSSEARPLDVAKVGQLLANRGAYGEWRLFSEETFRKFLPTKLAPYMPRFTDPSLEWGFANQYMPDPDGPREKGELGPNVIGHGSASSSIFRVDLDSGLVVVMGRYGIGDNAKYQEYRAKVFRTLRECVVR